MERPKTIPLLEETTTVSGQKVDNDEVNTIDASFKTTAEQELLSKYDEEETESSLLRKRPNKNAEDPVEQSGQSGKEAFAEEESKPVTVVFDSIATIISIAVVVINLVLLLYSVVVGIIYSQDLNGKVKDGLHTRIFAQDSVLPLDKPQ